MIVWRFRFTTMALRDEKAPRGGGGSVGLSQTIHEEEYWRKVEQKLQTYEVSVEQIEDHHRLKTEEQQCNRWMCEEQTSSTYSTTLTHLLMPACAILPSLYAMLWDCTSEPVVYNTGAPHGTVLFLVVSSLFTPDFKYNSGSGFMQKFLADTAIVWCVKGVLYCIN